jgi:predicted MFS family arabinose efflux permease
VRQSEFTPSSIRAAIGAWAGYLTGPNAIVASTASLFIPSFSSAFNLNRTETSGLLLISPLLVVVVAPLTGRAIDRWGVRRILLPGALIFGLSNLLVAFARSTSELVAALFLLGIMAGVQSSVGFAKLISLWFDAYRGTVLSLCVALGAGLGSALMPQLVRRLVGAYGWRGAYIGLGAVILCVGLPLIAALVREPDNWRKHAASAPAPGITLAQALRSTPFWMLFAMVVLSSAALIGTIVHTFPMLTERGFSPSAATTALSLIFVGGVCGQTMSGIAADRFSTPKIVLPFLLAALAGLIALQTTRQVPLLFAGALTCGLGQGAEIALAGYLVSRFFGMRAFAGIYSVIFAGSNFGAAAGLLAMGMAHDRFGGYGPISPVLCVGLGAGALLTLFLPRYAYPSPRMLRRAGAANRPAPPLPPAPPLNPATESLKP